MDNSLIIDIVLGAVLLAGVAIGAHRGLFKSLMGLAVVIVALIGSVLLSNALAGPLTEIAAPMVENALVEHFEQRLDGEAENGASEGWSLLDALSDYGVPAEAVQSLLEPYATGARELTERAKTDAAETFRKAVSDAVHAFVYGIVHAVLVLVLYIALLIVLKLLVRALDHVFDLPVLSTLNGVGGALLGLVEAALLLYVAVYAASHLGVKIVTEHANDTYLLPLFLNHSPVELISSFTQKG